MHSDIKTILYQAEENYLNEQQVKLFQAHTADLAKRLEIYEFLREQEIEIFQPIADELVRTCSQESPELIEKALKHWLSIMRYGAMAMLLNNPGYLQHSVLEWLTEMVQAHQMQSLENTIYDLLFSRLNKLLSQDQFALTKPFLEQIKTIVVQPIANQVGV